MRESKVDAEREQPGAVLSLADGPSPTNPGFNWRSLVLKMMDLVNNRHRTADFLGTRANFIQDRIRILAIVFAGIVFVWIGIDYLTIPDNATVAKLAALRSLFAALYLGLAILGAKPHDLGTARLKLAALVTLPCLFYIASRIILEDGAPPGALMVYAFFPFITVAQLGVFSLPLLEGLALSAPAFATLFLVEAMFGDLLSLPFFGNLTLLVLLTCLALWASMSELQMLLRLYRQATRDPLTGLFNRGGLMERTKIELEATQRDGDKLCVLLFDLDKFKRINDDYGHLTGDAVLTSFARILERASQKSDLIGRYGGEEFLVVLPRTDAADAELLAEQIRRACTEASVVNPSGDEIQFTTSVGVARLKPGETVEELLRRVDESLYQAKEAGRDCVILAA